MTAVDPERVASWLRSNEMTMRSNEMKKGEGLTDHMTNQEKVLAALLTSSTKQEAAAKAGISSRQLRRYLDKPEFLAEYQRRKTAMIEDATTQLQNSLSGAIAALSDIAEDERAERYARISAARAILLYCVRYTEASEIIPRLERLEEITNESVNNA